MKIGIVGSGRMGKPLGELLAAAGHQVMFSDAMEIAKVREIAGAAGPGTSAGTPAEAVAFADIVIFAVPYESMDAAVALCGALDGKVVLEIINPLTPDLKALATGGTTSAAEELARRAPGARIVAGFNTIPSPLLDPANQSFGGTVPSVFYCGDDAGAKEPVAQLIADLGFDPVDSGPLASARMLEAAGCLLIHIIIANQAPPQMSFRLLRR